MAPPDKQLNFDIGNIARKPFFVVPEAFLREWEPENQRIESIEELNKRREEVRKISIDTRPTRISASETFGTGLQNAVLYTVPENNVLKIYSSTLSYVMYDVTQQQAPFFIAVIDSASNIVYYIDRIELPFAVVGSILPNAILTHDFVIPLEVVHPQKIAWGLINVPVAFPTCTASVSMQGWLEDKGIIN